MLTVLPHHQPRHVRPHPPRRQLGRRRAVDFGTRLLRDTWRAAAERAGLPRPAVGAFWKWLAVRRGERARREGRTGG